MAPSRRHAGAAYPAQQGQRRHAAQRTAGIHHCQHLRRRRSTVLALGDPQYANFCAFGRLLDEWLHGWGANRHFDRIEVDNGDPAKLAAWEAQCSGIDPVSVLSASPSSAATRWHLAARTLLNAGSAGAPVFESAFTPLSESRATWESGDIAQITLAKDPGRPRDYSIDSVCTNGELQLLVRQERRPDGTVGAGSGLLTSTLVIGNTVEFRIRSHRNSDSTAMRHDP
jgi:sulfite reductase (NADPH) flavoprotein alpha-component